MILRLSTKFGYTKMILNEIFFHKMQEKHDEDKESKPWLPILFMGFIVRQEVLDISAD